MFYDRTLLILTTRRNCQRGKLPACRAVIKRKGNAGECEVGWTSSSFAMSSSSFSSSPYTKTVFMPSRQGFAKGVAHDQQQVHRLQVPPLPQVSTTQLTSTLLTFDQHQYPQYQHVEFLLSRSPSSSHRAGMRPDLVLDDYQINARWHHNFYLSCNLFLCKVQKGFAAQGGGEEEPAGGQGASHM